AAGQLGSGGATTANGGAPSAKGGGNAAGGTAPGAGGAAMSSGAGGVLASGGVSATSGGAAGAGGGAGAGGSAGKAAACPGLPAVTDYSAPGPFADAKMFTSVGPSNKYTLYRPDASLGKNGFKHPVATWGNGILTTPDQYQKLLGLVASHGFVIIAC